MTTTSNISSTLVETVSIDYEDFNESFLTCGTCLCMYDGVDHTPKLLPCSHTICIQCLDRIVATFARDTGQFRCPICRDLISIPRGGVQALPPSFLVNQLLDLMARQRREVVPKCSIHQNQELLFCETCDVVFCTTCTVGPHSPFLDPNRSPSKETKTVFSLNSSDSSAVADHTIIPFSIAIKRMSEILIYKANECNAKLNEANKIVSEEIHRLDHNADFAFESVNTSFQAIMDIVEKKRLEVLAHVKGTRDEKRKILEEQLKIIQTETKQVDHDVKAMQHQVEVRNITKMISDLNCKLDVVSTLSEPRENSYIEFVKSDCLADIITSCQTSSPSSSCQARSDDVSPTSTFRKNNRDSWSEWLSTVGHVKTSKTFPPLCICTVETAITYLQTTARVTTIDYNGERQTEGGDPVTAEIVDNKGIKVDDICIEDKNDGVYVISFTPTHEGTFCLRVHVFERPIRDCPLFFEVVSYNSPIVSFGSHGIRDSGFIQPCGVTVGGLDNHIYVIDTGNSRIKVLNHKLDFQRHIYNDGLKGRSVTGISIGASGESLICINWRSRFVTEISIRDGATLNSFTHELFQEPIDVAVDTDGNILIADNGLGTRLPSILTFDTTGQLIRQLGAEILSEKLQQHEIVSSDIQFRDISAIAVSPISGDLVVADSRCIRTFNPLGILLKTIGAPSSDSKQRQIVGRYGGIAVDKRGYILASRCDVRRSYIQVIDGSTGTVRCCIDSHGSKLKRPTGVAICGGNEFLKSDTLDRHVVVVDIGCDDVRIYKYL